MDRITFISLVNSLPKADANSLMFQEDAASAGDSYLQIIILALCESEITPTGKEIITEAIYS